MTDANLINLRDKINEIDNRILDLINKRSQIVNKIRKFKDKKKSVVDSRREQEILDRLLRQFKGHYSKDSIIRIWRELFYASSQIQVYSNSDILAKRGIENIQIYKGGKSIVKGQSKIIKLSSN